MPTTTERRSPADKHEERRRMLAESALQTLGELGYARTSLREIANNSEFSHGIVHYYFDDKRDLIVHCVREYKKTCVLRYDGVIAESTTPEALLAAFAGKLVETIVDDAPMHRLWYDLRAQALFDDALRDPVLFIDGTLQDMIWRVVSRYSALADRDVVVTPEAAYAMLDGLFQQALLNHLCGQEDALPTLAGLVPALMPMLLAP